VKETTQCARCGKITSTQATANCSVIQRQKTALMTMCRLDAAAFVATERCAGQLSAHDKPDPFLVPSRAGTKRAAAETTQPSARSICRTTQDSQVQTLNPKAHLGEIQAAARQARLAAGAGSDDQRVLRPQLLEGGLGNSSAHLQHSVCATFVTVTTESAG